MALKRTSHAVYDTKYHLVWAPKYRKWMKDEMRRRVRELFEAIARDFGFEIEAMEIALDHVHLFISFPPRYAIAKVVGILKSISSSALFKEYPELRKELWSGEFFRRRLLRADSGRYGNGGDDQTIHHLSSPTTGRSS